MEVPLVAMEEEAVVEEEGEEEEGEEADLSALGHKQRKMKKRISGLEDAQLAEKPWQHQGEVTSRQRPLNSLLEATLDFKQATKAAPVETEEQSRSIEEVIKARVKEETWDDVVRKQALPPTRLP